MLLPSGQSNRLQSILAGNTQHYMTLLFSFLEIFISSITPSTFLHAIAPACILRRTSTCTLVQWLGLSRITRPARVQSPGWEARIIRCKNLALYIRDCESLGLSDETLKAVGPFYLVSMQVDVNNSTIPHWNV